VTLPLVTYQWTGEAMVPLGRFRARCAEAFTIGEFYRMTAEEERSWRSHRHYFACIFDAWLNLPESAALETWAQTSEHLRKYALIKTGWHDSQTYACESKAEALRLATALRAQGELADYHRASRHYSIVVMQGSLVTLYMAKSQSVRAMGKNDFQKSKDDVLNFVASLSGTTADKLGSAA